MGQGIGEVLAPAGSFESMKAAIGAGADGVYIGGSRFGARAYADNLDRDDMCRAIDYAHIHGVSLYMTVNTLMKEKEIGELFRFLQPFYEEGLDGVIVQDLGALSVIRRYFPDLPVHASTQMTVTGVYGARLLAGLGVKRVVAARELSLEEIRRIRQEVPIEMECFVHGALCYCYSGQCLLSSFIGGRSGNRGRCAQPCRLPYDVLAEGKAGQKQGRGKPGDSKDDRYILSMKDLCTLDLIPDLIEAGIDSLKIEGRMKSPRYTAGVVHMYRRYVDRFLEKGREGYRVAKEDRQELLDLFDRGGFTDGYYGRHNGPQMIARKEKPAFRQGNQKLFDELDRLYVNAEKKEPVDGTLTVREGEDVSLTLNMAGDWKGRGRIGGVTVTGPAALAARNQPAAKEQLARQMKKTGGTPFEFQKLDICLEGQVFLPVQKINELRREGLEQLKEAVINGYRRECLPADGASKPESRGINEREEAWDRAGEGDRGSGKKPPRLHVLLSKEEALYQVLAVPEVSEILIEADQVRPETWKDVAGRCHDRGKSCVLAMPVIFRKQAEAYFDRNLAALAEAGFDGVLIRSLEEIQYLKEKGVKIPFYGDHNLYSFNSAARRLILELGCERTAFPLELNAGELMELGGRGKELIGYGYLPAMVSAQCVQKTMYVCEKKTVRIILNDRTGKGLYTENHCTYCYNIIYNPAPLSLIDQTKRIGELAPEAVRLQFTAEEPGETGEIVRAWAEALGDREGRKPAGDFTRGHFKRGVE